METNGGLRKEQSLINKCHPEESSWFAELFSLHHTVVPCTLTSTLQPGHYQCSAMILSSHFTKTDL